MSWCSAWAVLQSSPPTTSAAPTRDRGAAWIALGASTLFVALLAALHLLKPELDPAWRMMSEYALGRHGWVMTVAFGALTVSYLGVAAAVTPHVRSVAGWIGLVLLVVSAPGTTIAGMFPTDPITVSRDAITASGQIHGIGALLGIPTFPIAATLITRGLWRNPAWAGARRLLLLAVSLSWLGLGVFILSMATQFRGTFGPDVLIGWQNRLLVLAYSVWAVAVAWLIARDGR